MTCYKNFWNYYIYLPLGQSSNDIGEDEKVNLIIKTLLSIKHHLSDIQLVRRPFTLSDEYITLKDILTDLNKNYSESISLYNLKSKINFTQVIPHNASLIVFL